MIEGNKMVVNNDFFNYELPDDWCYEENEENLSFYAPDGDGAMTVSFLRLQETAESLDEKVSIIAKKFIDQNQISIKSPLILSEDNNGKKVLFGEGTTDDGWFIKLWVVAKYNRIVLATYHSEHKNKEIQKCDSIINSLDIKF